MIISIKVEASETIQKTIERGDFKIEKDGSGHKMVVSDDVTIPSRKCAVEFSTKDPDSEVK